MKEEFPIDIAQAAQSAISMNLSVFNGVFALAAVMAGRGLLTKTDVQHLHDSMLAPLTNEGGSGEVMALQSRRIDELCAAIAQEIEG